MRLLPLLAPVVVLAVLPSTTQAGWNSQANLPVPGRTNGQPFNPAATWSGAPMDAMRVANNYPHGRFYATPQGVPPSPPPPPFGYQPGIYYPINLPQAPDFYHPNCYGGVYPPFQPFQGMLLAPMNNGGGGMGGPAAMGCGIGFGVHPFARSPRDFWMVGD